MINGHSFFRGSTLGQIITGKSKARHPRAQRLLLSFGYAASIICALSLAFGPRGLAAGAVTAFLFIAWRHDNKLGVFLPLAVLVVIVLAVMFAIFYLLASIRP